MHIPDGYLGPKSCGLFFALMLPVWYAALKRVETTSDHARLTLLSFSAAFVFVLMLFNFPLPGGTSGHVTGAAIAAIALGPWAGVFVMSLALFLQAFLFGDGGITAYGANAFNMAFLASFTAHYVYCFIYDSGAGGERASRVAAFIAAYASVNAAALMAAVQLGLQPLVAHAPSGAPLYAPYPLLITLPAVMGPHLLIIGPVEGLATALTLSVLFKTAAAGSGPLPAAAGPGRRQLLFVLASAALLSPVGLLAGAAPWGEWEAGEFSRLVGFVPEGMAGLNGWWQGLLPGYAIPGLGNGVAYVLSALVASAASVLAIYLWGRLSSRR